MVKRLLDANASDFETVSARDLVESIRLSEGRVVAAEVLASAPPLLDKVSNAELAAGMGADILLLNFYDVTAPQVTGFPDREETETQEGVFGHLQMGRGVTLTQVKAWTGRPVGLNLEPVERPEAMTTNGRLATAENARAAVDQGADFIVITGNPHTGVTTEGIARALREIHEAVGEEVVLFAGKMHAAGAAEPVVTPEDVETFAEGGADGILLPAPGTVPGMTVEGVRELVAAAHEEGLLVMNTVGTSQEGASVAVIERLALMSKMTGADVHHLGDAGTLGVAIPENITAWSIALRGRRHTWHRMTTSLRR
jgi:heptaprenylglyceryl phosphate synthase